MSEATRIETDGISLDAFGHTAVVDFSGGAPAHHSDPGLNELLKGLAGDLETVDLSKPVKTVHKADSIVVVNPQFVGGGTNLSRLTSIATRAQISNKPFALLAVTAWLPRSWAARKMMRHLVSHSDLTLVADETSADILTAIGIEPPFRLGADPAWASLASLMATHAPAGDRVIWVSSNSLEYVDRYVRRMATMLAPLAEVGLDIKLQASAPARSARLTKVAEMVGAELGIDIEVIPTPTDLVSAREIYAGARLVIATEKRSLMAAAASGSPTVAISLSEHAKRTADNLNITALAPLAPDSVVAQTLIDTVVGAKSADQAAVLQNIDRARASISMVRTLLSKGAEMSDDAIESLPLYPRPWR